MTGLKHKITYALAILLAALLMLPLTCYAADPAAVANAPAKPVDMHVSYGIDNSAKGGRYLPVSIEFSDSSEADFDGRVSIFTKDNDEETYEYIYEVSVKAGSSIKKIYYVPLGVHASKLKVKLCDRAGNIVCQEDVVLNIDTSTSQLLIGLLSDTPEKLDYFDNNYIDYGLVHTKTFALDAESFPTDITGLDMFDIILISNFRIRDLSEEQSRTLMEWVTSGGVLMLGTGERVDDTLGRYAPELLDDMYEEPDIYEVNLGSGIVTDSPMDGILDLYCVYAPINGANVVLPGDDFPLVMSANKENGLVVIAAFDFADITEFAHAHSDFADNLIMKSLGNKRIEEITKEMYGTEEGKSSYVQSLVNTGDINRLPPIRLYALSIIAYILLAGPGLFLFLKSRDAGKYYRAGVIILAVCFAVIVYLMGSKTRFRDTFYNYASIQDVGEDTVSKTTYVNIRDPYSRSYEVAVSPKYTVRPVTGEGALYYNTKEDLAENPKVRITYETDATRIGIGESSAFASNYFELGKSYKNESSEGFSGDINLFRDKVSGSVKNNFTYDVTDAAILALGKLIILGDIKAGETVDLSGKKIIGVPLAQSETVGAAISGLDAHIDDDEVGSDYLRGREETSILAFYRDYYFNGHSSDVRMIAFAKAPVTDDAISSKIEGYGTTLLTSLIPTEYTSNDYIYRSAFINNPVCISGEYSAESNSIITSEPAVLEYQLGNDLDLTCMIFEWPEIGVSFTGVISMYNYSTGSYDSIDPTKLEYSKYELGEYLSPSNTIRMRYTYRGAVLDTDTVALPMISVVGTERE